MSHHSQLKADLFTLIGVWTVSRKNEGERGQDGEKKERKRGGAKFEVSNRREKQTGSGAERDKQREQERDRRERRELVFM